MSELSTAVCSITPTQRRRFFWAAWWTAAPSYAPFRKPDASNGGAASIEEALAEAERIAQRHLVLIEPYWARAWKSVLRGQRPEPPREAGSKRTASHAPQPSPSPWSVLGLEPGAPLIDVKRAFRKRALETHPDRGGDAELFRAAQSAYEKLVAKLAAKGRPKK